MYHKWQSYDVWFLRYRARQNFLSFWTIFCPLTTQKIKILKNWKKTPGDIIILHKCTKNHDHMLYCSWDMVHDRCNCYFSFWAIFCPFTPLTTQKIKISKKWKKHLEISSFYTCVPKIMITWCTVPEIWCVTDGQMKKVKYRGGCSTQKRSTKPRRENLRMLNRKKFNFLIAQTYLFPKEHFFQSHWKTDLPFHHCL